MRGWRERALRQAGAAIRRCPRRRPQTIPEAGASNDKRVERGAADGDGKQEGDRLFVDHLHGSFLLFCCGSGPGAARERVRRPGLRIIWGSARNFQTLRRTKIFHDLERKLQATRRTGAAGQGARGAGDAANNIRGELMAASRVLLARPLRRGAWPIRAAKGGQAVFARLGRRAEEPYSAWFCRATTPHGGSRDGERGPARVAWRISGVRWTRIQMRKH